jgi:pimeloyl-ACP methyl ester carboxylesterase
MAVAALILAALGTAGANHQTSVERRLRAQFPPTGKLVDVGERRLHLYCTGSGDGPTVVIEAGAGAFSVNHWGVQKRVAEFARVCTYDRAGYGWSDPAPAGRSLLDRVHDLHAVLHLGGVPEPYVLAGHSMGGLLVQIYQNRYPKEVAGMVLIEGTNPNAMFGKPVGRTLAATGIAANAGAWAVSVGLKPVIDAVSGVMKPPKGQPPESALSYLPGPLRVRAEDLAFYGKPLRAVRYDGSKGSLHDLPLAVVTRKFSTAVGGAGWNKAQTDLAAMSTRSSLIAAERSGHNVNIDRPDVVADAVRRVWEMAR